MIRHAAASSSGWIGLRRELSLSTRRSSSRDPVVPAPPVQYTRRNDCSDRSTPRTQRALSLRIGPQIQTLLSSEGRRKSGRRTGQSRSGKATGSIVPGSQLDAETRAYPSNGSALESNLDSWLRAALAHATQNGRQLSEDFIRSCVRLRDGSRCCRSRLSVEEIVVGPLADSGPIWCSNASPPASGTWITLSAGNTGSAKSQVVHVQTLTTTIHHLRRSCPAHQKRSRAILCDVRHPVVLRVHAECPEGRKRDERLVEYHSRGRKVYASKNSGCRGCVRAHSRSDLRSQDAADLAVVHRIKSEAFVRSQVMDHLHQLTDVHGPRLTGSTQFEEAAKWTTGRLAQFGLSNIHFERFPFRRAGRSISSARAAAPHYMRLTQSPLAWSDSTAGAVTGEPLLAPFELSFMRDPSDSRRTSTPIGGNGAANCAAALSFLHPRNKRPRGENALFKRRTDADLAKLAIPPEPRAKLRATRLEDIEWPRRRNEPVEPSETCFRKVASWESTIT